MQCLFFNPEEESCILFGEKKLNKFNPSDEDKLNYCFNGENNMKCPRYQMYIEKTKAWQNIEIEKVVKK